MEEIQYDAIILGAGPAGLTAGIYLARAKAKTLILDTGTVGGQLVLTHEIANYPGVESSSGYQLSAIMRKQAQSFGCDIKSGIKVNELDLDHAVKRVTVNEKTVFKSASIILASGGRSRMLNVPGEIQFKGRGISYCATCDGDFFQDKNIVVVGGGNSALEEAVSLTKYASNVSILHEFDHFQAFEHAVLEAKKNPKIDFIMETRITEFSGNDKLSTMKYKNLGTGKITEKEIDGAFIFIGYEANTEMLKDTNIALNDWNEIIADENLKTNIDGVFVAGDSRAKKYRQVTTAVSDGTIAALEALQFIHTKQEPV